MFKKKLFFVFVILSLVSSVRASQNRGVVYDLKDYWTEVGETSQCPNEGVGGGARRNVGHRGPRPLSYL